MFVLMDAGLTALKELPLLPLPFPLTLVLVVPVLVAELKFCVMRRRGSICPLLVKNEKLRLFILDGFKSNKFAAVDVLKDTECAICVVGESVADAVNAPDGEITVDEADELFTIALLLLLGGGVKHGRPDRALP